ncbi:MAG: TRAP transporter small permease [Proteobacteria bacterium]|nr:TRAP transporter small permease [Pseudomonadota bacterium]
MTTKKSHPQPEPSHQIMRLIRPVDRIVSYLEQGFVILALATMVILSFVQVLMRDFFAIGFGWADELLRHLVLWTGFIAGSMVTKQGRHIAIDVMSRTLPMNLRKLSEMVLTAIAILFSGFLFKVAVHFVQVEKAFGQMCEPLHTPLWVMELVFPITFCLLTIRFTIKLVEIYYRKEE